MAGRLLISAILALSGLGGCTTLSPDAPFGDVAYMVEERTGAEIRWQRAGYDGPAAQAAVDSLLSQPLTASNAMRVALLNNRALQAQYAGLGIAQADLVQAALPPNPVVDGTITFTDAGGTNLVFAGAMNILEVLYIPLKKRIAASKLEEAKLQVAGRVVTLASETNCAFVDYLASRQTIELLDQAITSTDAAVAAAKGMREAGNISALDYETQNAELIREKLRLTGAKTHSSRARERLNVLMGLTGSREWSAASRLPKVPANEIDTGDAEQRALESSLELAALRQELVTLAGKYRMQKATALIPELSGGGEFERDDGEKEAGPIFEAAVPLFDWGKAKKAKARMEIMGTRDAYSALAVKIRSQARGLREELLNSRKSALYHQSTALPQSQRLLRETQRQHNAMQLGVFRLIRAKRDQIQAGEDYVKALATYWIAKARFMQLMRGTLPAQGEDEAACAAPATE